jgi:arylsulfate sulfotransferase
MTETSMQRQFHFMKVPIIAGAAVFLLILLVLAFLMRPVYAASEKTLTHVKDAVARQQTIEQEIRAAYQAGSFTFSAPLVLQDPYQTAPLTALLIFTTPENSQISIHVPGKTPEAAVEFTFPGFEKYHQIPVYGLYAGTLNHVTLSMKTQNGESAQTGIDLKTEPLPVYIRTFTIDKLVRNKYNPGFNFALLDRKTVFDIDGEVRWYSTQKSWEVLTKLKNGRYLFTYSASGTEGDIVMEQDLLGKIHAVYKIADGVHHDIYELPTGNLLMTSADLRSDTIEDYLIEVDRKSGHFVRSFDLKDILDPGRPHQVEELAPNDWLHLNSVVYDPSDDSIIVSSKAQSAVVKLSYPGIHIQWILGPHDNWSPKYQPYLLSPVGKDFEWSWSQHHATLYSPDNPGDQTFELLLFDNANYRSFVSANAYPPSEWYGMVAHYRINEASRTVELAWEYGRERGSSLFSALRGSAYRLPNGNVLGTWGDIYKDAEGNPSVSNSASGTVETKIIEVDPSTNEVIFECSALAETYRTMRAGIYDGYSEEDTYLSGRVNDTSGNDLLDRSVMAWRDVRRWTITPLMAWLKKIGHQVLAAIQ